MRMTLRILSVFMFISLFAPINGRAEDPAAAPAAPAPPFTLSGFVDTYYGYNFNKPKSMTNGPGTNFDFNTNTFGLNLAELVVSKDPAPVGFRMDFDYGPTTDFVHCGTVNCNPNNPLTNVNESTYKNIQQAYVTWATPYKVTLDMGKFVTHMGAEVIESKDNWNYTRSLLFCCAIPYYHAGVRANLPVNDMLYVNGYVYNGWNDVIETNAMKTFGAQIGITPIKQLPIVLNWIGPEEVLGVYNDKQVYDAIVNFNPTDALSFMVNYDYGSQKDQTVPNGKTMKYSGVAVYARWKVDPCALAVRYEMVNDKDNLMFGGTTPNGNKVKELTVTGEHTIAKNLLTRLEYRMDKSDDKIYETKDSATNPLTSPKNSQSRVVLSAVYMF
ncbi:MAG: porin [Nitrospirae bacterium]|nr:porin [Nitrospirota bacterium]